jgi:nitrate reductase gamma subunit
VTNLLPPLDPVLWGILPYVAFSTFLFGTVARYRVLRYTYSSLSSQFLENRQHFWGLVPFHYGILTALAGHLIGFVIPRQLLAWNSVPLRLYVLEVSALAAGLLTLVGLTALVVRRVADARLRTVTTPNDWIVFALLLIQVAGGAGIAVMYPWGSSWFAAAAVPYLRSVATFNPAFASISLLPWPVKLHIVGAYLLIGWVPFSRLVHILVVPIPYLWRRPQVARWYRRPAGSAA